MHYSREMIDQGFGSKELMSTYFLLSNKVIALPPPPNNPNPQLFGDFAWFIRRPQSSDYSLLSPVHWPRPPVVEISRLPQKVLKSAQNRCNFSLRCFGNHQWASGGFVHFVYWRRGRAALILVQLFHEGPRHPCDAPGLKGVSNLCGWKFFERNLKFHSPCLKTYWKNACLPVHFC